MSGLKIKDLGVFFDGVRAVDGVSMTLQSQGIHALIGPNGAGKTSLVNAITGVYRPSVGRVTMRDIDITGLPAHRLVKHGITRTFQNLQVFWNMTVAENVLAGFHLKACSGLFRGMLRSPALVAREAELGREALQLLDQVNLSHRAENSAGSLSYGELKRLEIARALAASPSLLFLDEPVAGCTTAEKRALGEVIRNVANRPGMTVVLIEHDMRVVMEISDFVSVLVSGRVIAEGSPSQIQENPAVIEAYLGQSLQKREQERHYAAG